MPAYLYLQNPYINIKKKLKTNLEPVSSIQYMENLITNITFTSRLINVCDNRI